MKNNVKQLLIFCLSFLFLFFTILLTHITLIADTELRVSDSGKVNLLSSYWYEGYNPRLVLGEWKQKYDYPIVGDVVDKAATIVYLRYLNISMGEYSMDTLYVLTAYPQRLGNVHVQEIVGKGDFWCIYQVTR